MGDRVSGEKLATYVCRQTQPTGAPGTYRHAKSRTQSQDCSHAQTPGHPLAQMPESPGECAGSLTSRLPRSRPPPHARLSPSSRRPRSPRRAEPPRRPLPLPLPASGALQLGCSLFTLPLRLSRRRLRLSGGFVSISRFVSPGSSSLTRVIFQSQTPRTFPSLSVLTWVEGPAHPSRPHLSHPRGRGRGGSCLSACPSPPWSLRLPINFPPAAAGFHRPSPPPT